MSKNRSRVIGWLCVISSGMSACGGGGSSAPETTAAPTAVAGISVADPASPGSGASAPAPAASSVATPPVIDASALAFDRSTLSLHCDPALAADWIATTGPSYARRVTPRDCLIVQDNPPTFAWAPHPHAVGSTPYRLSVVDGNGSTLASATSELPYLHLSAPLPSGDLRWQVSVETTTGTVVSEMRRFRVGPEALTQNLPDADTALATARDKARPRLLPEPAAWQAARASALDANGSRHALYQQWRNAARAQIDAPLASAPQVKTLASIGSAANLNVYMNEVHNAAELLSQSVVRMAVLAQLDDDTALRAEAVRRLNHLAGWDPDGMTSEALQDQANRQVFFGLAAGYDLLFDALTPTERTRIEQVVAQRVKQQHDGAFATLRTGQRPYDSHGVTGATFAAAATMLMAGSSAANDAMSTAYYRWLVPNLLVWGEQDGSDGNGHAYGWFNLVAVQPTLVVMNHVAGAPLTNRGVVRNSPRWQAQFTPPPLRAAALAGSPMTFGDGSDGIYAYVHEFHATLSRLFAAILPNGTGKDTAAWLAARHPTQAIAGQQEPLFLLTAPPAANANAPAAPPLADAAVFPDAGLVSMHSSISSPTRSSLFFRASRFGTYSHSMADNGSFVFAAGGLPLIVNSGYYDYYWSDHHARYARQTKSKNALTVDGGLGQALDEASGRTTVALSMAAPARLIGFRVDGDRVAASADLAAAYRTVRNDTPQVALLDAYKRTVAYDKAQRTAFILDAASSGADRTFELNYHSVGAWTTRADGGVSTANAVTTVCLDVVTAAGELLTASRTDRFLDIGGNEVLPTRPVAPHAHLTLATTRKAREFQALTVIREDCNQPMPEVTWAADRQSVRIRYASGSGFGLGATGFSR